MTDALKLYAEFCDMDFWDHSETASQDLKFISELVKAYGIQDARQILTAYFE